MTNTHFWVRSPESDQCREGLEKKPFTHQHYCDHYGFELLVYQDGSAPCNMPREAALEIVNKWNREAETYRYWID